MNKIKLIILTFVILCLDGCASYKANKIPTVDYPKNQNRMSVTAKLYEDRKLKTHKILKNHIELLKNIVFNF